VSGWRRYRGPKSDARVPRGTKYGAKAQTIDGLRFASKLEAARYQELVSMEKAGVVNWFIRQPSFDLGGGVRYVADFLVVWTIPAKGASVTVEDCKGFETAVFRVKQKLLEARYPRLRLTILRKGDVR